MNSILERLFKHDTLTHEQAHDLLCRIAAKEFSPEQVAALLTVFRMRDIRPEELTGFRQALIEHAVPTDLSEFQPIDIVGTGGDGKNTFNISTCACFVVAGAGYKVAKHGNYGASSVSGASTVLELHHVRFTNSNDTLRRSIDQSGVAYLHAPLFHPALATVGPVRRSLGFKTIFNLLGPLVNPCKPSYQMLGVADLPQLRLYSHTLRRTGLGFTVLTSLDGYDEISLTAPFKVITNLSESIINPSDLGLPLATQASLHGGKTAEEAAQIFDHVLCGEATAEQENCVLVNAAFAIHTICPEKEVGECVEEARRTLTDGKALQAWKRFVEINV